MKIRKGFISNSSSCSFVVFGKNEIPENELPKEINTKDLVKYFGWGPEQLDSFSDKLAWVIAACEDSRIYEIIKWVNELLDEYNIKNNIDWDSIKKKRAEFEIGVDHGSLRDENLKMLESKEKLAKWLFTDSKILLQHDNTGCRWEYDEFTKQWKYGKFVEDMNSIYLLLKVNIKTQNIEVVSASYSGNKISYFLKDEGFECDWKIDNELDTGFKINDGEYYIIRKVEFDLE